MRKGSKDDVFRTFFYGYSTDNQLDILELVN